MFSSRQEEGRWGGLQGDLPGKNSCLHRTLCQETEVEGGEHPLQVPTPLPH